LDEECRIWQSITCDDYGGTADPTSVFVIVPVPTLSFWGLLALSLLLALVALRMKRNQSIASP